MMDKALQDPAQTADLRQFEKPVAESKYIVSVKAQDAELAELPLLLRRHVRSSRRTC